MKDIKVATDLKKAIKIHRMCVLYGLLGENFSYLQKPEGRYVHEVEWQIEVLLRLARQKD